MNVRFTLFPLMHTSSIHTDTHSNRHACSLTGNSFKTQENYYKVLISPRQL